MEDNEKTEPLIKEKQWCGNDNDHKPHLWIKHGGLSTYFCEGHEVIRSVKYDRT